MCVLLWRFATEIAVRSIVTLGIGSSQTTIVERLLCKRVVLRISIGLEIYCIWRQGSSQQVRQLHTSYLHVAIIIIIIIKPPPSSTLFTEKIRPPLIILVSDYTFPSVSVVYLCFVCASPGSTASTHSYKMKYQEYKGLYYNAWSTNNIVLLQLERHNATNLLQL
jgi:hypothetical protein